MPVTQRFRQGIRALLAFSTDVDYDLAERYLNSQQMTLFQQMAKPEQLHSLNVLRDVLAQSEQTPHDLAVVALLHDSGKARCHLAVWQKTISVLVSKFLPSLDDRLSRDGQLTFWRAPFMVRRNHPTWSAQFLADLGCNERIVWLAEHHADNADQWHNHPHHALLVRLQTADDAN
ncbi:MAG: hypothetical protein AAF846_08300 [Chloroflexota bacterium]